MIDHINAAFTREQGFRRIYTSACEFPVQVHGILVLHFTAFSSNTSRRGLRYHICFETFIGVVDMKCCPAFGITRRRYRVVGDNTGQKRLVFFPVPLRSEQFFLQALLPETLNSLEQA